MSHGRKQSDTAEILKQLPSEVVEGVSQTNREESLQEMTEEVAGVKRYYCGFGKWHPKWLQIFANAKFFTFILCVNTLAEGALVSGELCMQACSVCVIAV